MLLFDGLRLALLGLHHSSTLSKIAAQLTVNRQKPYTKKSWKHLGVLEYFRAELSLDLNSWNGSVMDDVNLQNIAIFLHHS